MNRADTPRSDKPHPTPLDSEKVHERPEVKPLVDKARAERDQRVPQGTMKTGSDVLGGGGTKSLKTPPQGTPRIPKDSDPKKDD